jgi:FkbM family methyltransferase
MRKLIYRTTRRLRLFFFKLLEGRIIRIKGPLNTYFNWVVNHNYPPTMSSGSYEIQFITAMLSHLQEGDCFFDVGANSGYFSIIIKNWVKHGKVMAFEPLPYNIVAMKKLLAANPSMQFEIIAAAVNDYDGECVFETTSNNANGRIRGVSWKMSKPSKGSVTVNSVDLNKFIYQHKPKVIKIDTEGCEGKIVGSFKGPLEWECEPVFFIEIHGYQNYRLCFEKLNSINYNVLLIDNIPASIDKEQQYILAKIRS